MGEPALDALTTIELREAELLAWGAVGAEWTEDELLVLLAGHGEPTALLRELFDAALVIRSPNGGYRSRVAETVRLLATLRQAFPGRRVTDGRPLVLDHRFLHRPRRRPKRDVAAIQVLAEIRGALGQAGLAAARHLIPVTLSGFQRRSTVTVLEALISGQQAGAMITAGTGSGKSLAFYLPLISWLANQTATRRSGSPHGTLALALYPRNELLKDQLRTLVRYAKRLGETGRSRGATLSVATWFGPTPASAYHVQKGWAEGWEKRGKGYVCPYLRCLECGAELVWPEADCRAGDERLVCTSSSCKAEVEGKYLRLTRDRARQQPADLMLSTTESLNRQLAAPSNLGAFGVRPATLAAVLLDEVHTYEGTAGAQNALLLRRLKHRLGRTPVWVGLSATLQNAGEFFSQLVDLPPSSVTVVEPDAGELEESGAEYLLALRHDPHSGTGTLSTTIQACMALARCLDSSADDPFNPPPSSGGAFGSRLFAFTDKLDSTNRLYWDLLDAEGWKWPGRKLTRRPQTLAHLRGGKQGRLGADRREAAGDRDPEGQWWWLPDHLGHGVEADRPLEIGRTSSQDRGVATGAQVIVATATLEVGFDDDRVGAVLQHKAPHDAAQFLQRKGRAGRMPSMRPWTVVVLSDWGRDRQAWEAYDALFDPDLPPRNLPIENFYVLRIQAVYALLDWLSIELDYSGGGSTWEDLAGPASALFGVNLMKQTEVRSRQAALSALLDRLLRPGPERERLRRHLREALAIGKGEWADSVVDTLLWDAPRPLLLAVVPTMRRQLRDQWRGEEPLDDDAGLRTRTPLRQFVPGNLFDDLLVPDVELQVPGRGGEVEVAHLSALRVLNEFCPGNVSRHFGVWATNKRHWLPLPTHAAGEHELLVDVGSTYRAVLIDLIDDGDDRVAVYSPVAATLEPVLDSVRDASSVRPEWRFHVSTLGVGSPVRLAREASRLLEALTAHLHVQGGGIRSVRYARTARGTVWEPRPRPVTLSFGLAGEQRWLPAAVGVDVQCDALEGRVRIPDDIQPPTPQERSQRLRHRLEVEADLPNDMSVFDRDTLVDVVLLAATSDQVTRGKPLDQPGLAGGLRQAAETLGLTAAHETGELNENDERRWESWLGDPAVLSAVQDALREITGNGRSPAWATWWRRRFTLSAAQLALAALSALCPGVDTDDLMVDMSPEDDAVFWISEPSPGGTGHVEAFQRLLVEMPEAFAHALEDALIPSETETMDEELSLLVRTEAAEVRTALDQLRLSWPKGHAVVARATERVEEAAQAHGLALGGAARSALSTRLAGPGAHPRLLSEVASWLDLRDRVAEQTGIEVSTRTLGALMADHVDLDEVLHLGARVTAQRRARAVSNVLWPWGQTAQPTISSNPYAPRLGASFPLVREHVDLGPVVFDVAPWDDKRRKELHEMLIEHREVALRVEHGDGAVLRSVLLELQTEPVEVGALLCHPMVFGVRKTIRFLEARVLLREAP
ncbi:protein DpdJ [Verrucosispora sp. ts21]|uniref:protein DpdJ n=1 Tax=Verrucosispora sp. ts21 TaxID=2069341 RepID=UPI0013047E19|nr:protein DpdJ [Verrucosispora sp. ts21]